MVCALHLPATTTTATATSSSREEGAIVVATVDAMCKCCDNHHRLDANINVSISCCGSYCQCQCRCLRQVDNAAAMPSSAEDDDAERDRRRHRLVAQSSFRFQQPVKKLDEVDEEEVPTSGNSAKIYTSPIENSETSAIEEAPSTSGNCSEDPLCRPLSPVSTPRMTLTGLRRSPVHGNNCGNVLRAELENTLLRRRCPASNGEIGVEDADADADDIYAQLLSLPQEDAAAACIKKKQGQQQQQQQPSRWGDSVEQLELEGGDECSTSAESDDSFAFDMEAEEKLGRTLRHQNRRWSNLNDSISMLSIAENKGQDDWEGRDPATGAAATGRNRWAKLKCDSFNENNSPIRRRCNNNTTQPPAKRGILRYHNSDSNLELRPHHSYHLHNRQENDSSSSSSSSGLSLDDPSFSSSSFGLLPLVAAMCPPSPPRRSRRGDGVGDGRRVRFTTVEVREFDAAVCPSAHHRPKSRSCDNLDFMVLWKEGNKGAGCSTSKKQPSSDSTVTTWPITTSNLHGGNHPHGHRQLDHAFSRGKGWDRGSQSTFLRSGGRRRRRRSSGNREVVGSVGADFSSLHRHEEEEHTEDGEECGNGGDGDDHLQQRRRRRQLEELQEMLSDVTSQLEHVKRQGQHIR